MSILNNIKYLCPSRQVLTIENVRPCPIFHEIILEFLNELCLTLLQNKEYSKFSDIIAFAFWCRKASITEMKKQYENDKIKIGRGIIFHIAPSNVPINFAYSLVAGLLAGNVNIVKISSKEFAQTDIICSCINKLLENDKFQFLSNYIIILQYSNDKAITDYLSDMCDIRVIWGGGNTINEVRQSALKPKSFDITFSDRYSICLINADKYIHEKYPISIGKNFYNDVYFFDQNACTAPHLILWYGSDENIEKSKKVFWGVLYDIVKENYEIQPISVIDKFVALCESSLELSDIVIEPIIDSRIIRINLKTLPENIEEFKQHSGYFFEYTINTLKDISNIANRKYQTLTYYGFDKIDFERFIHESVSLGIDRIVPIGKTLEFSLTWDGYDLINILSREIVIIGLS